MTSTLDRMATAALVGSILAIPLLYDALSGLLGPVS